LMSEFEHYIISLSKKVESEIWRENLLERYRKELLYDPTKSVKFDVTINAANMALNIVSNSAKIGFKRIKMLEDELNSLLRKDVEEANVEVVSISGGLFNFMHDYDPQEFLQDEYPMEPGNEQWKAQKPLGRKAVVQYDKANGQEMLDGESVVQLIDSVLEGQDLYRFEVYTDIGDGVVVVSDTETGSLIALWDGRDHIDLNIFMHDDSEIEIQEFIGKFNNLSKKRLRMGLRDDFPRGTGRVMNFRVDLTYNDFSSIKNLEPYVDMG